MFSGVIKPTLEIYLPDKEKSTGAAVVICPGGGYAVVVYQAEGIGTAKEFAKNGVAAFVLKYRLPSDSTMIDKKIGPLQDAQRAIKVVRENASRWGIDTNKVGIMGFSAGGHLASTEATHYRKSLIENDDNTKFASGFSDFSLPGNKYGGQLNSSWFKNKFIREKIRRKRLSMNSQMNCRLMKILRLLILPRLGTIKQLMLITVLFITKH